MPTLHLGAYATQLDQAAKARDGSALAALLSLTDKHGPMLLDFLARPERGTAWIDRTLEAVRWDDRSEWQAPPKDLTLRHLPLAHRLPRVMPDSSSAPSPRMDLLQSSQPCTSWSSSPSTYAGFLGPQKEGLSPIRRLALTPPVHSP